MRRRDRLDPTAEHELAVIDAALAGRAGDPGDAPLSAQDAELAELATLLVAERPEPAPEFRAALDTHAARRFAGERVRTRAADAGAAAAPADAAAPSPAAAQPGDPARRGTAARRPTGERSRRRRFLPSIPTVPALAATCAVGIVAIAIALGQSGGGEQDLSSTSGLAQAPSEIAPPSASDADGPAAAEQESAAGAPQATLPDASREGAADSAAGAAAPAPVDPARQRKVEQSSTIVLGAPADQIDDVAQGVLGVVGRHGGIVDESSVATSGEDGEARFELRIPAARLQPALAQLSELPGASVLARTDDTLDVNQAYVSVARKLSGAEAERRGLVRALANADDEAEAQRLRFRLDGVEGTIATLERDQRALDRRVDYSRVELTVRAHEATGDDEGGAFTPGRALDDAGRLLAVTAGVVVIAAAALVPVAIVLALLWPAGRALRRRRREHALDATA